MRKRSWRRGLSALLILVLLVSGIPRTATVNAVAYENTYKNTGNQRADIVGVALTQLGYSEGANNDTKYGTWYGLPNQPWCAMFISWCADIAGVSTSILEKTARAHPGYFDIPYKSGSSYTPKPGDLFFNKRFSHVGLVYYVEGSYFYTIEGNSNNNGSDEGTGVFCNKRRISDYYFGIPAYEGCDKDHDYVLRHDSSHPHKEYYLCQTCGDKYYTTTTAFADSCKSCTSCGCSASYAGYYYNTTTSSGLTIRSGHGTSYSKVATIPAGGRVYVIAASGAKGWAHVRYEAYEGYASMEYLQPVPAAPSVSVSTAAHYAGDTVKITWNSVSYAESYRIQISRDGTQIVDKSAGTATSYSLSTAQAGAYTVKVTASNKAGTSQAGTASFTVLKTYAVTYDTRGGTGGPPAQTKKQGVDLTLSKTVPTRTGYTFLGWTTDSQGSFVTCKPGAVYRTDAAVTLYAVWRSDTATPQTLAISTMPARTMFVLGESLDTTGLVLDLTYSDGAGLPVTEGFTASGILAQELGTETVTVTYEGLSVTYDVQIVEYIPGDFTKDGFVTEDDAIYLLRHVLFSDIYPIDIPGDLTLDGDVTEDDAIYLLRHVLFPEMYPLTTEA